MAPSTSRICWGAAARVIWHPRPACARHAGECRFRVMAKAGTDEACGRRPTTSAASVETCSSVPVAPCGGSLSLARSATQDESRSVWSRELRRRCRAHGRRAGRPAAARWRVAVRRQPARRPGRSGRAPGAHLAPAGTGTDHADTLRPRERNATARATEGRSCSRGRRRWLQIGRSVHPAPPARTSLWPRSAGAILAVIGRSSGRTLPRAAAAVTSRFGSAPSSFGREQRRRARRRRRRAALKSASRRSSVVAQPQAVGERPADPRLAVGTFAWALNRAKPPALSPGWKLPYPGMGTILYSELDSKRRKAPPTPARRGSGASRKPCD